MEISLGQGPVGNFDATHLKAIHRHLFQDVYEWAGHSRDERVRLSDGSIATEPILRKMEGKPFMEGPQIAKAMNSITQKLAAENHLRKLDREAFAVRAADLLVELNGVHPFREGNGRTQRVFLEALADNAGYKLDFSVVSRERMIQASIAGNEKGDPEMMRRLFQEISDPVRVAALNKAITFLQQHGFAWNDRYIATSEPGRKIDARLAGAMAMARPVAVLLVKLTTFTCIDETSSFARANVYPGGCLRYLLNQNSI